VPEARWLDGYSILRRARHRASWRSPRASAGAVQSLRIDRSFVDGEGVRWIVDWKTSVHEGGDREAFLDNELERYRGQLERYVHALRAREPDRPVRAGLYFPLLDAWREL
jgi:ATP-dependent exoDNAse (exonuclease V) beta subunit